MACRPGVSTSGLPPAAWIRAVLTETVATPPLRATGGPIGSRLSKDWTDPVGVPLLGPVLTTVAVKVNVALGVAVGLALLVVTTVVVMLTTTNCIVPVLAAKFTSPL